MAVTSVRVMREAVAKAAAPLRGAGAFLEVSTISSSFSENWEMNLSASSQTYCYRPPAAGRRGVH